METPRIGKRVNIAGEIGTVVDVHDGLAVIAYDRYEVRGLTLASVVAALPELVSRGSFEYRPGDREEVKNDVRPHTEGDLGSAQG